MLAPYFLFVFLMMSILIGVMNSINKNTKERMPRWIQKNYYADYAKTTDIPTTLPANGGNADTVNNHTVESDVPENAVFTDTVYDDTEVKGNIDELSSNLSGLSDNIDGFKNVQIISSLGSVKLKEIIQSEFPKLKNGRGMIRINDGTTLYCGTYIKYSNTQGSTTFTNVEGASYIWIIKGDTVTLQELATMDKIGSNDISAIGDGSVTGAISTVNANLGELCNKKIYCGEVTGNIVNGYISISNPIGKVGNVIATIKYVSGDSPRGYSVTAQITLVELNFYFRWHRESNGAEAYPPDGIKITMSYMIFY